jgi:hypothetical protein
MIQVIMWQMFFSNGRNVMIGSIHSWTHESLHTCIDSDEILVLLNLILNSRDQGSGWTSNIPPIFHEYLWFPNISGKNFEIFFFNSIHKHSEIYFMMLGMIWNTDSSTKIDEFKSYSYLYKYFLGKLKEKSGIFYKSFFTSFI